MNCRNITESVYRKVNTAILSVPAIIKPLIRRMFRFLAIPYCFILIDWEKCPKNKIYVICDLFYIFFILKYYPDNYFLCKLWEVSRDDWKYYYGSIYDPYQRKRLNEEVQRSEYQILFNDKEVCYDICKGKNLNLPNQLCSLDPSDDYIRTIADLFLDHSIDKVIIKPCNGSGGHGILLGVRQNSNIYIRDKTKQFPLHELIIEQRSLVQEYLIQHEELAKVAPSFNTVRIVTLLSKGGNVIIVGALARFGVGNAYVDNTSSGGIAIGINIDNGRLRDKGHDFQSNDYLAHPDSKILFNNIVIPFWPDVISFAKNVQKEFGYYKMLGQDIGITHQGPVLVEINPLHDNVGLEQSFGPILLRSDVRRVFREYNLFVNDKLNDM